MRLLRIAWRFMALISPWVAITGSIVTIITELSRGDGNVDVLWAALAGFWAALVVVQAYYIRSNAKYAALGRILADDTAQTIIVDMASDDGGDSFIRHTLTRTTEEHRHEHP